MSYTKIKGSNIHTSKYKMAGTSREMRKLPSEIMITELQENNPAFLGSFFSVHRGTCFI